MRRFIITPQAERSLDETFAYLEQNTSARTVDQFLQSIENAFSTILEMPFIGIRQESVYSRLQGMRKWIMSDFRQYLVFYRVAGEDIEILLVSDGRRDLPTVFRELFGESDYSSLSPMLTKTRDYRDAVLTLVVTLLSSRMRTTFVPFSAVTTRREAGSQMSPVCTYASVKLSVRRS